MEKISIIYEDDDVLVLNKPAGIVVHPDGRTEEEALTHWVLERDPHMGNVGESLVLANGKEIKRPGVVHRIDRDTSGVIVLARTQESFLNLKMQFQNRTTEKKYNAFVYGKLKEKKTIVELPIGKSKSDFRLWSAEKGARGELRDAYTEIVVLKEGKEASFIEVIPRTGRTHQIRVHTKALQHPIVCDSRYAPKRPCLLGFNRLALHARIISFKTLSGKALTMEAPFPDDFLYAIEHI